MNYPQYFGSEVCGMCAMVNGTGQGAGANPIVGYFKVFVNDLCPECLTGALDLSGGLDGR